VIDAEKNGYGAGPGAMQDAVREYQREQAGGGLSPSDVEDDRLSRLARGDEPAHSPPGMGPVPGAVPGAGAGGPTVHAVIGKDGGAGVVGIIADLLSLPPLSLDLGANVTESNWLDLLYKALSARQRDGTLAGAARSPAGPRPGSTPAYQEPLPRM
jgi:hypothetical protein